MDTQVTTTIAFEGPAFGPAGAGLAWRIGSQRTVTSPARGRQLLDRLVQQVAAGQRDAYVLGQALVFVPASYAPPAPRRASGGWQVPLPLE